MEVVNDRDWFVRERSVIKAGHGLKGPGYSCIERFNKESSNGRSRMGAWVKTGF